MKNEVKLEMADPGNMGLGDRLWAVKLVRARYRHKANDKIGTTETRIFQGKLTRFRTLKSTPNIVHPPARKTYLPINLKTRHPLTSKLTPGRRRRRCS